MKKPVLLGAVLLLAALSASGVDNGYCTDESCSEPNVADVAESSGSLWQSLSSTIRSSGSYMQSWDIFSTIQEYLIKIKDTIVHNINKKAQEVYEKLEDFADRVRNVFREEFGSFLEVLWERALGTAPESDTLFWRFKNAVEHRLLILGLIILCLIISYIIWATSFSVCNALIWILLFNSSVLLIYKLMGPKWVYYIFGTVVWYTWDILSYIWTYPYISAGVIFVLFVGSIVWSVFGRLERARRESMQTDMIRNINDRLRKMEEKQNKILLQQDEILRLLQNRSDN